MNFHKKNSIKAYLINDDTLIKRARHAVIENQRTLRAQKALSAGELEEFGKLVNASHISLHYDYEVTGKELDTLAETAWKQPGVLGARMTGAGFGGCAIAIVNKANVDDFIKNMSVMFTRRQLVMQLASTLQALLMVLKSQLNRI